MAVKVGLLLVFASLCLGSALAFTVEESGSTTSFTWIGLFLAVGAVLLVADQVNFRAKKKHLPGPSLITPFIGEFWASLHPKFEAYQKQWNSGPLSCTQVFQKFIIIGSTNELSRKMFNTPGSLVPCLVAAMKQILTPENFVFLQGKAHVDYRKRLNPLFTKRALSIYLPIQQKTYKEHIDEWISLGGKPVEYQSRVRDLNMATSLAVFCGNYLSIESQRKISDEYYNLTQALQLVNFPLALPGTKVYNAIKARKYITEQIAQCALKSREKMSKPGAVPTSMLDAWIEVLIKEQQEYKQNGEQGPAPPTFSETDIALTVLTFIFASQDASSSSVTWMLALLAEHRDVLEKIREEQKRLRPNNEEISYEMLEEMKYTRQVVKEILRYRPPVLMVPYEATKDCQITQDYVIPKGAIVVPSIWPTQHDPVAFKDPSKFDPDRFSPERAEDVNNPQHWLVFGHGPHGCIGKEYAMVHLVAFTAILVTSCDWKRIKTDTSDGITIRPTIYPTDQCIVSLNAYKN